jgi:hypothetical protein
MSILDLPGICYSIQRNDIKCKILSLNGKLHMSMSMERSTIESIDPRDSFTDASIIFDRYIYTNYISTKRWRLHTDYRCMLDYDNKIYQKTVILMPITTETKIFCTLLE